MILTITPNPALDVTYRVARLVPHASHRVDAVHEVAGGKGVNVASVLHARGLPVLATGVVGGPVGEQVVADLDARGIAHDFLVTRGCTRRTMTVVGEREGDATAFNEPGAELTGADWVAFADHVQWLLRRHRPEVVVASGSVPHGFPPDGYAVLVQLAAAAGARVVLDASRDALLGGLPGHPDVVKPNRDELRAVTGVDDPVAGARLLQAKGARHVLVSLGPDGMCLVTPDGEALRAVPGQALRGNPTGAGDAAVAAVASGLAVGAAWPQTLLEAVAWSSAAVLHPLAGHVEATDIDRLRTGVQVQTVEERPCS